QDDDTVYVCQYFDSEVTVQINEVKVRIVQRQDHMSGSMLASSNTAGYQAINEVTAQHENMPSYRKYDFVVQLSSPTEFAFSYRIPEWTMSDAIIYVNDECQGRTADSSRFYNIRRTWRDGDRISILLPIGVRFIPLPDDENTGAFRYGPEVLAGLTEHERILYIAGDDPTTELEQENEREWGSWRYFFKTTNQDPAIQFNLIRDIGYDPYQVYFTVKKMNK